VGDVTRLHDMLLVKSPTTTLLNGPADGQSSFPTLQIGASQVGVAGTKGAQGDYDVMSMSDSLDKQLHINPGVMWPGTVLLLPFMTDCVATSAISWHSAPDSIVRFSENYLDAVGYEVLVVAYDTASIW